MFVYGIIATLYSQDVSFTLVEFISVYFIYQWLKSKSSTWLNSRSLRSGQEVVHPEIQGHERSGAPGVDIIMLSVTMIQTIHDTYRTEYELNSLLTQLKEENEFLNETYENQRQMLMQEKEQLEFEKFNLEVKVRRMLREINCLEEMAGTSGALQHSLAVEKNAKISAASTTEKAEEIHDENTVDSTGDHADAVETEPRPLITGEGDNSINDKTIAEEIHQVNDVSANDHIEYLNPMNGEIEIIDAEGNDDYDELPEHGQGRQRPTYSDDLKAQLEYIRSLD